jgi:hypothetical protein
VGLRALREEMPSEESCRVALARLGLSEPAPRPLPSGLGWLGSGWLLLGWLLLGALLGALALLLQRWFAAG